MLDSIKYKILPNDFSFLTNLSFQIIFIGDTGVGKSKLLQKSIKGIYDEFYSATDGNGGMRPFLHNAIVKFEEPISTSSFGNMHVVYS